MKEDSCTIDDFKKMDWKESDSKCYLNVNWQHRQINEGDNQAVKHMPTFLEKILSEEMHKEYLKSLEYDKRDIEKRHATKYVDEISYDQVNPDDPAYNALPQISDPDSEGSDKTNDDSGSEDEKGRKVSNSSSEGSDKADVDSGSEDEKDKKVSNSRSEETDTSDDDSGSKNETARRKPNKPPT